VPVATRQRADAAVRKGVECILASQVMVQGVPTIWGQQHDALTLEPVKARSYEHPSLASRESAGVVAFLMELPEPDARVTAAVRSAVEWFKANTIQGLAYDMKEGVVERPDAGPAWARMSEIGTNRPIYSNRDGVILYDYKRLTDRKTGYLWISTEPAEVLELFERWNRTADGGQRTTVAKP
jgi:PelA/Pel-15E family pectate lyase